MSKDNTEIPTMRIRNPTIPPENATSTPVKPHLTSLRSLTLSPENRSLLEKYVKYHSLEDINLADAISAALRVIDAQAILVKTTDETLKILRERYFKDPNRKELVNMDPNLEEVLKQQVSDPIPMRLTCPECKNLHIDVGEFATKPHHTHACQHCGNVWRPALVNTVGVQFLPGFKNG